MLKSTFSPLNKPPFALLPIMKLLKKVPTLVLVALAATFAGNQAKAWESPVSPAIAPGFPGAPGQEGRSGLEREDSYPCVYKGKVVVLRTRVAVNKAASIHSTGGSVALSLFGTGLSGGLNRTNVGPNLPEAEFTRQLDLARADTIISCAALDDNNSHLHRQELDWALRTQRILRRGDVSGFAASEAAQAAYNEARNAAGANHPKLAQAERLASQGMYKEATELLRSH